MSAPIKSDSVAKPLLIFFVNGIFIQTVVQQHYCLELVYYQQCPNAKLQPNMNATSAPIRAQFCVTDIIFLIR